MIRPRPRPRSFPRSLALALLVACAAPAAYAQCVSGTFTKSHVWDDLDADSTTSIGDVLRYTVVFCEGGGNRRCSFEDVVPAELQYVAGSALCTPDAGTPAPDRCGENPPGSGTLQVVYQNNRMPRGACVTLTFEARVSATPIGDVCNQAVNINERTDVSNPACQPLVVQPDLDVAKAAAAAAFAPGDPVPFRIDLRNVGAAAMRGAALADTLDGCFEALGVDGSPCDPLVVRCQGPACAAASCVYANGGRGFRYAGLDLAADDAAAGGPDEVQIDVVAVAGAALGPCTNLAETSDPSSPSITSRASVEIAQPDLAIHKQALASRVAPGNAVGFRIVLENLGKGPLSAGRLSDLLEPCFEPLGPPGSACDPLVVQCQGAGCAGVSCAYAAGGLGFTLSGIALAPADGLAGGADEIALTVTATAGPIEGLCANTAETSDPDSPLLASTAKVEISSAAPPDLEVLKSALSPSVVPGAPVDFAIVLRNTSLTPLVPDQVLDTLDACFEPLGIDGGACDPLVVSCVGAGCASGSCSYANGGLGFRYTGLALAPSDAAPGGPDELTLTVRVTAGGQPGACANQVQGDVAGQASSSSNAVVTILTGAPCALMQGDMSSPPRQPDPASLYVSACPPGAPRLALQNLPSAVPGDLGDRFDGSAGTLRLYQLDCPCVDRLALVKNFTSGAITLGFF